MNTRLRLGIILFGALIVLATYTFPLWRSLFTDSAVEVVFEGLPEELEPAFQALPPREQQAYLALAEENREVALRFLRVALGPDFPVAESEQAMPELTGEEIIGGATFSRGDDEVILWATGEVVIYQEADGSTLIRFEDFRSARAPGLRVALSRNPAPETVEDLGLDRFEVGGLQGNVGSQNYRLPPEVDIRQYSSIVIYSGTLNLLFSAAALSFTV